MTSEFTASVRKSTQPRQRLAGAGHFTMLFSSTPRGARLARRMAGQRLDAWDVPYGSAAHDDLSLVVAELAANAVRHGRAPGRDFRLTLIARGGTVRVEVADTRGERPPVTAVTTASGDDETAGGRGLVLVEAVAARWGWGPREDGPGKTVWAEYEDAQYEEDGPRQAYGG